MEKYLDWIINEQNIAKGFFGGSNDGKITLHAKVYPNIEVLYNFLKENQIVSVSFGRLEKGFNTSRNNGSIVQDDFNHSFKILEALIEFCKTKQYSFTETARAFTSISTTGSTLTYNRAMNKIKKNIKTLPNIRKQLLYFLDQKGIAKYDNKIICETLSKDL